MANEFDNTDLTSRELFQTSATQADLTSRELFQPTKVDPETAARKQEQVRQQAASKKYRINKVLPEELRDYNALQSSVNPDYIPIPDDEVGRQEYANMRELQAREFDVDAIINKATSNDVNKTASESLVDVVMGAQDTGNSLAQMTNQLVKKSETTRMIGNIVNNPVVKALGVISDIDEIVGGNLTKSVDKVLADHRDYIDENTSVAKKAYREQLAAKGRLDEFGAEDRIVGNSKSLQNNFGNWLEDDTLNTIATLGEEARQAKSAFGDNISSYSAFTNVLEDELGTMLLGGFAGKLVQKAALKGMTKEEAKEYLANPENAKALAKQAGLAGTASNVIQESSQSASDARSEVIELGEADDAEAMFSRSPEYLEYRKNMSHSEAVSKLADEVYDIVAVGTAMTAGIASKVSGSGKFVGNLFTGLPLSNISKSTYGKTIQASLPKTLLDGARGFVSESVEEGIVGAGSTVSTNFATQQKIDKDQTLLEDVGKNVGSGAGAGGLLGGGLGTARGVVSDLSSDGVARTGTEKLTKVVKDKVTTKAELDPQAEGYDSLNAYEAVSRSTTLDDADYAAATSMHQANVAKDIATDMDAITKAEANGEDVTEAKETLLSKTKKYTELVQHTGTKLKDESPDTKEEGEVDGDTPAVILGGAFTNKTDTIKDFRPSDAYPDYINEAFGALANAQSERDSLTGNKSGQVSNTIFDGDGINLGLTDYTKVIGASLANDDVGSAEIFLETLKDFGDNQNKKITDLRRIGKLQELTDNGDGTASKQLEEAKQQYVADGFAKNFDAGKGSVEALTTLLPVMQREANAITETYRGASLLVEGQKAKQPEVEAVAETQEAADVVDPVDTTNEVVSDEEYNNYVKTGEVTPERLNKLADSQINGAELSPREQEIFVNSIEAIEDTISTRSPTTETTTEPEQATTVKTNSGTITIQSDGSMAYANGNPVTDETTQNKALVRAEQEAGTLRVANDSNGNQYYVVGSEDRLVNKKGKTTKWQGEQRDAILATTRLRKEPTAKTGVVEEQSSESVEDTPIEKPTLAKVLDTVSKSNLGDILNNLNRLTELTPTQATLASVVQQALGDTSPKIDVFDPSSKPNGKESLYFWDQAKLHFVDDPSALATYLRHPTTGRLAILVHKDRVTETNVGEAILHEAVHAVTETTVSAILAGETDQYTSTQIDAVKQLQNAFNNYNKWISKRQKSYEAGKVNTPPSNNQLYAATDINEFLTMGISNKEVMGTLRKLKGNKQRDASLFSKLTETIARILNFQDKDAGSLLAEVFESFADLTDSRDIKQRNTKFIFGGKANELFKFRKPKGAIAKPNDIVEAFGEQGDLSDEQFEFVQTTLRDVVGQFAVAINNTSSPIYLDRSRDTVVDQAPQELLKQFNEDMTSVGYSSLFGTRGALAVMSWYATEGSKILYNSDEAINGITHKGTNERVHPNVRDAYIFSGVRINNMANTLGKAVLRANGVYEDSSVARDKYDKLTRAVGLQAIGALSNMDVPNSNMPFMYKEQKIEIGEDGNPLFQPNDSGKLPTSNFINVFRDPDNLSQYHPDIVGFMDQLGEPSVSKHIAGMVDTAYEQEFPSLEAPTKVENTVRGGDQTVNEEAVDNLQKYANEGWYTNDTNVSLLSNFTPEQQERLIGVDNDITGKHILQRKPLEAKNDGLRRELNNFKLFMDYLGENKHKGAFYIGGYFAKNTRMHNKGYIDPQASKVVRHLIKREGWDTTYDPTDTTGDMLLFGLALGEALDIKVANQTPQETLDQIDTMLRDPKTIEVLDALDKVTLGEGDITEAQELVVEAVGDFGEALWSMEGLVALNAYRKADGKPFTSTLTREIDGINNGVILSLMQYGGADTIDGLFELLNKGGVYGSPNKVFTYNEWKTGNINNADMYEALTLYMLTNQTNPQFTAAMNLLANGKDLLKDGRLSPAGRKISKSPVMTLVYGVSEDSMIESLGDDVLDNIYAAYAKGDVEHLERMLGYVKTLTDMDLPRMGDVSGDPKDVRFNYKAENQIRAAFASSYGDMLNSGLDNLLGTLLERRDSMTQAMAAIGKIYTQNLRNNILEEEQRLGRLLSLDEVAEQEAILSEYAPKLMTTSGNQADAIMLNGIQRSNNNTDSDRAISMVDEVDNKPVSITTPLTPTLNTEGQWIQPTKTSKIQTVDYSVSKAGVSAAPLSAQVQDAFVANQVMAKKSNLLNVHDAYIVSPLDTGDVGLDQNTGIVDVMQQYDPMGDTLALFNKVMEELPYSPKSDNDKAYIDNTLIKLKDQYAEASKIKQAMLSDPELSVMNYDTIVEDGAARPNATDEESTLATVTEDVANELGTTMNTPTNTYKPKLNFNRKRGSEVNPNGEPTDIGTPVVDKSGNPFMFVVKNDSSDPTGNTLGLYTKDWELVTYLPESTKRAKINDVITNVYNQQLREGQLGSDDTSAIDYSIFTEPATEVNKASILDVFDGLGTVGNIKEDPKHAAKLSNLITNVFNDFIQPFKLHTASGADNVGSTDLRGNVYLQVGSNAKARTLGMSAQEVLSHEVVHDLTDEGITSDNQIKREVYKLWKTARSKLDYTAFIKDYDASLLGTPEYKNVEKAAKARYDRVFNSTESIEFTSTVGGVTYKHTRNPYLSEFMAYGLTNQPFNAALQGVKSNQKTEQAEPRTLLDKLSNLWNRMLESVRERISGTETVDDSLEQLALRINKKQEVSESSIWNTLSGVSGSQNMSAYVVEPLQRLLRSRFFGGKDSLLSKSGEFVADLPDIEKDAWSRVLRDLFSRNKSATKSIVGSALNDVVIDSAEELLGASENHKKFEQRRRIVKSQVDQTKQNITTRIGEALLQAFSERLNANQKAAITRSVLHTDLSALVRQEGVDTLIKKYSISEVGKFLRSKVSNSMEIDYHKAELKKHYPDQYYAYTKYAKSMANHMVNGVALEEGTPLSIYNLVNNTTNKFVPKVNNTELATELLDRLVTLEAVGLMHESTPSYNLAVADLIDNDPQGVLFTMQTHNVTKQEALAQNFDNKESQIIKGYVKELDDSNPDMLVLTRAEAESQGVVGKGYEEFGLLSKDKDDNPNEARYMYVNPYGGLPTLQSGIMSLNGLASKGQDLYAIQLAEGASTEARAAADAEFTRISNAKETALARINTPKSTANQDNKLIPITDEEGRVMGYRYTMSREARRNIFNTDESFEHVMGAMVGSVHDKAISPASNTSAIAEAKTEFDENYAKEPHAYVSISKNSSSARGREIYDMFA